MKKLLYKIYSLIELCFAAILFRRKKKDGWKNNYQRRMWRHYRKINRWWPKRREEFIRRMKENLPEQVNTDLKMFLRLWDYRLCAVFLGANINDWFSYHYFEKNWIERNKTVPEERLQFLTRYMNDSTVVHYTKNKKELAVYWKDFIRRKWCFFDPENRITEEEFKVLFQGLNRLIVKPVDGGRGAGIYLLEGDLSSAYQTLCQKNEAVVVDEYIYQTGFIHELNPSSLNTNRIITINADGTPEVLSSEMRIGKPGSFVDNIHAGGILIQVNRKTGEMDSCSDYKGTTITELPNVSLPVKGTLVPDHEKILQFCLDAHKIAPPGFRVIGWDVCRSDDGLIMIEGNDCPGFPNAAEGLENPWKTSIEYLERFDHSQPKRPVKDMDPYDHIDQALSAWFTYSTGEQLDLKNPVTYNQKIQWMKVYDSTPLKTRLADKYLVREYVKEKIGEKYLPELYGVWEDFDKINFAALPQKFVLKTNHGSGYNYLVPDKSKLDIQDARKKFKDWMNRDYALEYGYELHYRDIPRKIIAEEYLPLKKGEQCDYKVTCFSGEPSLIQYIYRVHNHDIRIAIFDTEWKLMPISFGKPKYEGKVPRPVHLEEMLEISSKLCEGFALARADLYILENDDIRFGELTFTPASGGNRWCYPEFNYSLGERIKLPPKYYLPGITYDFDKEDHKHN